MLRDEFIVEDIRKNHPSMFPFIFFNMKNSLFEKIEKGLVEPLNFMNELNILRVGNFLDELCIHGDDARPIHKIADDHICHSVLSFEVVHRISFALKMLSIKVAPRGFYLYSQTVNPCTLNCLT
jgi:hypothetical protein